MLHIPVAELGIILDPTEPDTFYRMNEKSKEQLRGVEITKEDKKEVKDKILDLLKDGPRNGITRLLGDDASMHLFSILCQLTPSQLDQFLGFEPVRA